MEFGCSEWAVIGINLYWGTGPDIREELTERVVEASSGCVFVGEYGDGQPAAELVDITKKWRPSTSPETA